MDADIKALEEKLLQLITLCGELRSENKQLHIDISAMQSDGAMLQANVVQASERIEALMESLP
jgi:cell division protein ZapB